MVGIVCFLVVSVVVWVVYVRVVLVGNLEEVLGVEFYVMMLVDFDVVLLL